MQQRQPHRLTFVLRGRCGDDEVTAAWTDHLRCSPALHQRALILLDLEEEFTTDATTVPASLDEPLPAVLTLIRALDRIDDLDVVVSA